MGVRHPRPTSRCPSAPDSAQPNTPSPSSPDAHSPEPSFATPGKTVDSILGLIPPKKTTASSPSLARPHHPQILRRRAQLTNVSRTRIIGTIHTCCSQCSVNADKRRKRRKNKIKICRERRPLAKVSRPRLMQVDTKGERCSGAGTKSRRLGLGWGPSLVARTEGVCVFEQNEEQPNEHRLLPPIPHSPQASPSVIKRHQSVVLVRRAWARDWGTNGGMVGGEWMEWMAGSRFPGPRAWRGWRR